MMTNSDLSAADSLRLNVLLTQKPEAVRIDESRMVLHALTPKGEVKLALDPNCEQGLYLRRVKELLSSQVMGSPGGYPVFLERWTRMGQMRDARLAQFMLLGESEAVVAVAHARGLTETLARRVWWAMPDAAIARQMLRSDRVATSPIGQELAAFLLEFLPFEQEAGDRLESVRLVLQPGLIDEDQKHRLWQQAQNKRSMLVGFLQAVPDNLPMVAAPHSALATHAAMFDSDPAQGDPLLAAMRRVFSAPGQAFVQTCEQALARLTDQEVTVKLFEAISDYFGRCREIGERYRDIDALEAAASRIRWHFDPGFERQARAVGFLSAIGVDLLNPIFAKTDAVGSGMRRKIKPITDRIFEHLHCLVDRANAIGDNGGEDRRHRKKKRAVTGIGKG